MKSSERGATLVVGLMLLALVALLGLAGAATAHIESQLAHNELFRENAASAASAGVEYAISRIVTHSAPESASSSATVALSGTADRFEVRWRFLGYDAALPQRAGAGLAGVHFEILSTGHSSRGAVDRQRAIVMQVLPAEDAGAPAPCEPDAAVRCHEAGELVRLAWQRIAS